MDERALIDSVKSESTKRRNPHLWRAGDQNNNSELRRRTPSGRKMTKCERAFYLILLQRYPNSSVMPQFRFRVSAYGAPSMVFYTADFLVSTPLNEIHVKGWNHVVYEVKDKRRKPHSDELTRPKMLRERNPWVCAVVLAVWDGGRWEERNIA